MKAPGCRITPALIAAASSLAVAVWAADSPQPSGRDGPAQPGWLLAGANPQRTSWVPEEVGGRFQPVWYRPIEPYISQNVQVN
jgi:hypothetical protein